MKFLKRLMGESPSLDYTGPTGGYLIVDVETSGLYPSQGHKITWLGTAYVVDGSVSEGLSVAMAGTNGLAVFGDAPASVPRHDARVALGWFANAAVAAQAVAAHNAAFDSRFMHATSQAVGQPMPTTSWLCTMLLARHFFPSWPNHKLTTCLREAGISLPREHDAGDEALATGHLLGFLLAHARGQGVTDLEDLLTIGGVDPEQAAEQSLGEASRGGSAGVSMMIDLSALTRDDVNRARTVCGDLLMEQITDPAHRAAHELEDALFGEGRDKRIEAYQALTDAGCPEAAQFWRNLPYWWGTGGKGEFDGSVYVLNKYREMGFEDTEDIRGLCVNASSDVYNLKTGPGMLLRAHEQLWEWLSRFGPCEMCQRIHLRCDCFNFSVSAGRLLVDRIAADDRSAVVEYMCTPDANADLSVDAAVAKPLRKLRESYPIGYAHTLSQIAHNVERDGDTTTARCLFESAVETGYATDMAYDRLSLMAERAKEHALAADLAEEGVRRTASTTVTTRLTKRANRCRAKA